jgi:hypothetical protein
VDLVFQTNASGLRDCNSHIYYSPCYEAISCSATSNLYVYFPNYSTGEFQRSRFLKNEQTTRSSSNFPFALKSGGTKNYILWLVTKYYTHGKKNLTCKFQPQFIQKEKFQRHKQLKYILSHLNQLFKIINTNLTERINFAIRSIQSINDSLTDLQIMFLASQERFCSMKLWNRHRSYDNATVSFCNINTST